MNQQAMRDGSKGKHFDWEKAKAILLEKRPLKAKAGLSQDLEWTAGYVWKKGKPFVGSYKFLSSNWAIPVLVIDGEEIDCWLEGLDGPKGDDQRDWSDKQLQEINALLRGEQP